MTKPNECRGFVQARRQLGRDMGAKWAEETTDVQQLQRVSHRNRGPAYSRASFWRDCIGLEGADLQLPKDGNWLGGFYEGVERIAKERA